MVKLFEDVVVLDITPFKMYNKKVNLYRDTEWNLIKSFNSKNLVNMLDVYYDSLLEYVDHDIVFNILVALERFLLFNVKYPNKYLDSIVIIDFKEFKNKYYCKVVYSYRE